MKDIGDQWNDYMNLGELVSKGELTKETLEEQIYAFSCFLCETNPDYHYNATYLPNYVDEFVYFLECFHKKYPLVMQIFQAVSSYTDVTLVIDRYWQQESVSDRVEGQTFVNYKIHPSCERKWVCDEGLLVECSILCETKRYINHSKTGIDTVEIQQEIQKLKEFLDDKTSSGNK